MCDHPKCWKYWCLDRERQWAEERRKALINRLLADPEAARESLANIRRIHGPAFVDKLRQECRDELRRRKREGMT